MGGEKTHTLSVTEIPSHSHEIIFGPDENGSILFNSSDAVGSMWVYEGEYRFAVRKDVTSTSYPSVISKSNIWNYPYTANVGGSSAHNNLQPYITVYMWKRVS